MPSSLNKIVMHTLKKNKNLRYNTALELEKDLTKLLTKAYPEFDRYDFSAFIKKTYAKDILNERENLKKYHKQFKEYMKIYFEQELSYETKIPVVEEKGFNTAEVTSTAAEDSAQIQHTQTDQPAQTGSLPDDMKKVTKSLADTTPTLTYDNSMLPETEDSIEKGSLSLTIPGQTNNSKISRTAKTIVKGGAAQLSHLVTDQASKSYSLQSISMSQSDSQNEASVFFLYRKTLILPLIYIALSIGICVGVILAVKNMGSLAHLPVINKLFENETAEKSPAPKTTPGTKPNKVKQNASRVSSVQKTSNRKPATTAVPRKMDVFVRTKPSGAMVQVNNKFALRTPGILQITGKGPLAITISKKGYHSHTIKVQKGKTPPQKIKVNLQRRNTASY